MKIPGVKTAKAVLRWAKARLLGGAMILGYHRIASHEREADSYEVCISPEHFDEQMEVIHRYANPLPLIDLVQRMQKGTLPPRAIAVTFDDGYLDNLQVALPILEKYGIPATVFVATAYAGQEFWWDEIQRLVQSSESNSEELQKSLGIGSLVGRDRGGKRAIELRDTERTRLLHSLYRFFFTKNAEQIESGIQVIRAWACVPAVSQPAARAMAHNELHQLINSGLVDLGSHTRSHPMLPMLSPQQQSNEIIGSKIDLEKVLGKPVAGFAYPNGRITSDSEQLVRQAGYQYACVSLHNVVRPGSNMFQLTRFWQKDVGGELFHRHLATWLNRL